jgi:hypothetical protein
MYWFLPPFSKLRRFGLSDKDLIGRLIMLQMCTKRNLNIIKKLSFTVTYRVLIEPFKYLQVGYLLLFIIVPLNYIII